MEFICNPFKKIHEQWALVTAGKPGHFNTMTISWGSVGTLWNKNVVTVYVRPERYTHSFMMDNDYFSICFFDEKYKEALEILGTKSGRDCDKVKESKLTPIECGNTIAFKEASETIICKKIYAQQFDKKNIPSDSQFFYGKNGEAHYMFVGEIVKLI